MAEMSLTENMAEMTVTKKRAEMTDEDISYGVEKECRMTLIGRTGTGKSATGNNILGREAFVSELCASSVTSKCGFHTSERFGKKLVVVDTPGLFDTTLSNEDITKEIVKCIGILAPGPHAFILVVQVGRITPEEQNTITHFSRIFGEEFFKYLIVLFTRKDDLKNSKTTIHEYVNKVPVKLKDILQKCGNKYLAFDNSPSGLETGTDALELVEMVQTIMNKTGKSYYSNEMFERAEQEFQRRAEEFRLEEKKKIDKEQKKIQKDLETDKKKIEAEKKEIQAKILELQAINSAAIKELEAKERQIEERENETAKLESKKKFELEKREKELKEKCESYRDNYRQECENGNEKILSRLMHGTVSAAKAVGSAVGTVLGWIF